MAINNPSRPFVWNTVHDNGGFPTNLHVGMIDSNVRGRYSKHVDSAIVIQQKLQSALDANKEFRGIGSSWSLSDIPYSQDNIFYNLDLKIVKLIEDRFYSNPNDVLKNKLVFAQCGARIKTIQEFLWKKGLSLKTCGASNGQSIAGAISNGVHGSSIDVGSIQDYIVGINLIVGPNPEDIVYLEKESRNYLNSAFAAKINARIIRNDDLFYAALVGLGSFGIVHAVVIEAEDLFLLKRYIKRIPKDQALELAETLDFQNSQWVNNDEGRRRPFHYKLFINPYTTEDYVAEIIYKENYRSGYADPIPGMSATIYPEVSTFIGWIAARFGDATNLIIKALESQAFDGQDEPAVEGTLGEIFWDTNYRGKAFGCAIAIDISNASKALSVLSKIMIDKGPIPGIVSMRFVKKSHAHLAFTKFDYSCILEVDGVPWDNSTQVINYNDFLTTIIKDMKDAGIEFTLHWGKNADWSFDGLVDYMYGPSKDKWLSARSKLLSQKMCNVFSNNFLRRVKLDRYIHPAIDNPIDLISDNSDSDGPVT